MNQTGKLIFFIGLGLVVLGLLIWLGSKTSIPFGRLPGDIKVQKERVSFYFPIVTSIVASIVLTVLINLILWIFRK